MRDVAKSANANFPQAGIDFPPPIGGLLKRSFDIAGSLIGLVATQPAVCDGRASCQVFGRRHDFLWPQRIGRGGRVFPCLKFRTMVQNGERVLAAYLAANPEANAEWIATRKLKNDPRVTRVGAVLRKLSLDELPQIINILQGDMSLVGPRPVVRDELEIYGSAAVYYLKSRPGLTGLWQVSGRNDVSYDTRVAFDRHYVENWSLFEDIRIIIKTVPAVWMSRGCY